MVHITAEGEGATLMADDLDPSNLTKLTPTLLDLLFNPLIADNLIAYFDLQSVFRLARTASSYRDIIRGSPRLFRSINLSKCKGAYTPPMFRIDTGGHSWRAERMDENLTEDEFYAGPLRFVMGRLDRMKVLSQVLVLVLDEMASVSNDVLHELITSDRYAIRLLSIRNCPNVNQSRLQQLLRFICRPTRPEGTPRLQGLYYFTNPGAEREEKVNQGSHVGGVTAGDGATLGSAPVAQSTTSSRSWYTPSGRIVQHGAINRTLWEETLQFCKGVIAFDAVLCTSMHLEVASCLHEASHDALMDKPGVAPIATVALGPDGCSGCGKAPAGNPIWGKSDIYDFPLQSPPPVSGRLTDALRPPPTDQTQPASNQRLIVSCSWCLANRHCGRCHRWWCADCYNPKLTLKLRQLAEINEAGLIYAPTAGEMEVTDANGRISSVKVFNGFCVERCLVPEMMAGAGSNGMWA